MKIEKADDPTWCTRCGELIQKAVWLELDTRTHRYTERTVPPEHSQGAFAFGPDCAASVIKAKGRLVRIGRAA